MSFLDVFLLISVCMECTQSMEDIAVDHIWVA